MLLHISLLSLFLVAPFVCRAQGVITTVAGSGVSSFGGDGGPATMAYIQPSAVTVDSAGNIYIADTGSFRVREVTTDGIINTIAGNGMIEIQNQFGGNAGDGGPAGSAGFGFVAPGQQRIAVDGAGNVYISDTGNQRIRMVDTMGIMHTVVGGTFGLSGGDGGPATGATLMTPTGLAMDGAGNLYIAELLRIRRVDTNGIITTFAGTGMAGSSGDGGPATSAKIAGATAIPITVDSAGNLYLVDAGLDISSFSIYNRIRKVDTNGIITTVAGGGGDGFAGDGGPAVSAILSGPKGLAVDAAGNLYIADSGNKRVRKVDTNGIITTVAGNGFGESSPNGDGGPATAATLSPLDVAVDAAGNLYIVSSNRIRKVTMAKQ